MLDILAQNPQLKLSDLLGSDKFSQPVESPVAARETAATAHAAATTRAAGTAPRDDDFTEFEI